MVFPHHVINSCKLAPLVTIVDLRINETLQTGAVENRTYQVGLDAGRFPPAPTGDESVYLFLEFTIIFGFLILILWLMLRFGAKKPSFAEKTRFLFVLCTFFLRELTYFDFAALEGIRYNVAIFGIN